jgi:hypothetical protein
MLEIVDRFKEKSTVDELGLGTIRDAFADSLFPGTSTLHSRARYFLFIPWVYRQLEHDRVRGAQMDDRARKLQTALVDALLAGGESEGVIGIEARAKLIRPPSIAYWNGLRRFGVRRFEGSVEQYHASIDGWYARGAPRRGEDGELLEAAKSNWDPNLPEAPNSLWDRTSFALAPAEADYLRERILVSVPGSLLALCLRHPRNLRSVDRPWAVPGLSTLEGPLRDTVEEARRFALLMQGAVLLYNIMLAEAAAKSGLRDASLVDEYRDQYGKWVDGRIRPELDSLRAWSASGTLWATIAGLAHQTSPGARRFARDWMAEALADPWGAPDREAPRQLVIRRERLLKRSLARLASQSALERWSGASGLGELTYRWPNARTLIVDILDGIKAGQAPDA